MRRLELIVLAITSFTACVGAEPTGPSVTLTVAPLTLSGITDARYQLAVRNAGDDPILDRTIDSRGYGAGDGSLSYVGPCDASSNPNVLSLTLLDLYEGDGGATQVDPASYANPGTVETEFTCVDNADVAVDVALTVARDAQQGFFDVAVDFDNIFCSAKLDCVDAQGQPLRLLFDAGGARARTAVVALACTGGLNGADTTLYRDDLVVACTGGTATVDPSAGPGNLAVSAGITDPQGVLFAAAVYRGDEQLGYDKRYWNVLLGLAPSAANCTLATRATAARDPFAAGTTPTGTTYPFVVWSVPLTGAGGALACTHHPLGGASPNDGVAIAYTGLDATRTFTHAFGAAPTIPAAPPAASCDALRTEGETADGVYAIDPDGEGGADPFDVYCDMNTAGGGWTLVAAFSDLDATQWANEAAWSTASTFGTLASIGSGDLKSPAFTSLVASDMLMTAKPATDTDPFDTDAGYWRQTDGALGTETNLVDLYNALTRPTSACFGGTWSCAARRVALTAKGAHGGTGSGDAWGFAFKTYDFDDGGGGTTISPTYYDDFMGPTRTPNAGGGVKAGVWSGPDLGNTTSTPHNGEFCGRLIGGQLLVWLR